MKFSTYTNKDYQVIVEAYPAEENIHVFWDKGVYECALYTYTPLYFLNSDDSIVEYDNSTPVEPFIGFFEGKLCVFYNGDKKTLIKDDLSYWGRDLMELYLFDNNLSYFSGLANSTIFNIADTKTKIKWIEADEFSYSIEDANGDQPDHYIKTNRDKKPLTAKLTIYKPSTMTKIESMTLVLQEILDPEVSGMINNFAEEMMLWDHLDFFVIKDPSNCDWTQSNDKDDLVYPTGVFGASYKTNDPSLYSITRKDSFSNDYKLILFLSPIMLFLEPKEMISLVVHELVHIKIGVEHGHDSYFWYLYERFSGLKRTQDSSYSHNQEVEDTINFDTYYKGDGLSVAEEIAFWEENK